MKLATVIAVEQISFVAYNLLVNLLILRTYGVDAYAEFSVFQIIVLFASVCLRCFFFEPYAIRAEKYSSVRKNILSARLIAWTVFFAMAIAISIIITVLLFGFYGPFSGGNLAIGYLAYLISFLLLTSARRINIAQRQVKNLVSTNILALVPLLFVLFLQVADILIVPLFVFLILQSIFNFVAASFSYPRGVALFSVSKEVRVVKAFLGSYGPIGNESFKVALFMWFVDSASIVILKNYSNDVLAIYRIAMQLVQPIGLTASISATFLLNHVARISEGVMMGKKKLIKSVVIVHSINGINTICVAILIYLFGEYIALKVYGISLTSPQIYPFFAPFIAYLNGVNSGNVNILKSFGALSELRVISRSQIAFSLFFILLLYSFGAGSILPFRFFFLSLPIACILFYKLRIVLV